MKTPETFEDLLVISPIEIKEMIFDLKTLEERPDFHPEENAYEHVKIVTERLMLTKDPDLIMAGLFHDIAKKVTAKINPKNGYPTSIGHDRGGAKMARKHSKFIEEFGANPDNVIELCSEHMRMKQIDKMRLHKQQAIKDLKTYDKLVIFTRADNMLEEFIP